MNLELSLKQTLKLSPQMLQSMEILQMSTLELNEYIQELVQENPAAELAEPPDPGDESEELWRRLQSLADLDHQNRQYVTADRDELDPLARVGTDGGTGRHPAAPSDKAAGAEPRLHHRPPGGPVPGRQPG